MNRSARREVRNPILALPTMKLILALPDEQRGFWHPVLLDLRNECLAKARESERKCKWMMYAYWRVASVYIAST